MGTPNKEMNIEYKERLVEVDPKMKFFVYCPTENLILYEAFEDNDITRIVADGVVAGHWIRHPSIILKVGYATG